MVLFLSLLDACVGCNDGVGEVTSAICGSIALFILGSFLIQKMASCVNMDTGGLLLVPFDASCRDASIDAIFIRGFVCFGVCFWKLEGRKNSELVPI
jgi:hypothetical protein